MSSCFLCDCSYVFKRSAYSDDYYPIIVDDRRVVYKSMKQLPIMIGSSGIVVDHDQQHNNNDKQNYVSYRVKKIEFCCSYNGVSREGSIYDGDFPDYVLIFKVPFREPVFDYHFTVLNEFMLFSEPECVLDYKVLQPLIFGPGVPVQERQPRQPNKINININKPFVVCPNDYVGVLYMLSVPRSETMYVNASARVWFDVV